MNEYQKVFTGSTVGCLPVGCPGYGRCMAATLVDSFGDLLAPLKDDRRAHSLAVGRKAEAAAAGVRAALRADVTVAAVLHDIGYGHVDTGFHPLDGARFLARAGFLPVVCNLAVHHSAST